MKGWGTPIPDKQIEDLQTLLSHKVPCGLYPFLHEGQRMRVRGGCLEGVEGILVELRSDHSLVLSLDAIHRSVVIRITGYDVEARLGSCSRTLGSEILDAHRQL